MKKFVAAVIAAVLLAAACSSGGNDKAAQEMSGKYETLNQKYQQKLDAVRTRADYEKLMAEWNQEREQLLTEYQDKKPTDSMELMRSRILIDMGKYGQALTILDKVSDDGSDTAIRAKFEKVRALQAQDSLQQALRIFKEIKPQIKKSPVYYDVLLNFAFSASDPGAKKEYSNEILNAPDLPASMQRYIPYMYENLAAIARQQGDVEGSKQILKNGIEKLKASNQAGSLESTLKLTNMIGKPAPSLSAKTWVNSRSLKLDNLKGKVVVVDFWAPWCSPCRSVIPHLVEEYNAKKDDGLVVLGYTRLYGRYSDDQKQAGQVEPEEEIRLTKGFVNRFEISYPVAIAHNETGFNKYSIRGIPTMIFIDKQGKISDFKIGSGDEAFIRNKIQSLLES